MAVEYDIRQGDEDQHYFTSKIDKTRLAFYRVHQRRQDLEIIFLHDLYDYHRPYISFFKDSKWLAERGVGVSLLDMRGHGYSGGARSHLRSFNDLVLDLNTYIDHIVSQKKSLRVILMGAGLGGLLALKYYRDFKVGQYGQISGLYFINPLFEFSESISKAKSLFLKAFGRELSKLQVNFPFDSSKLFKNEKERNIFKADVLMNHSMTFGALREIIKAQSEIGKFYYQVDIPSFFLLCKESVLSCHRTSFLYQKTLPKELTRCKIEPRECHNLLYEQRDAQREKEFKLWFEQYF